MICILCLLAPFVTMGYGCSNHNLCEGALKDYSTFKLYDFFSPFNGSGVFHEHAKMTSSLICSQAYARALHARWGPAVSIKLQNVIIMTTTPRVLSSLETPADLCKHDVVRFAAELGWKCGLLLISWYLQHFHFVFDVLSNCAGKTYWYSIYWLLHAANASAISQSRCMKQLGAEGAYDSPVHNLLPPCAVLSQC